MAVDLATSETVTALRSACAALNPSAHILTCARADIPLADVLHLHAYDAAATPFLLTIHVARVKQACGECTSQYPSAER